MRTFYVVDNEALQSLTSIARTAALTELKRAFDFVGQVPKEAPVTFSVLVPSSFPETFDLSDGVVRLATSSGTSVAASMRQQSKIVAAGLKKHNVRLEIPGRVAGAPERLGVGSQFKHVQPLPGGKKVALVLMAAEVSIPAVARDYADALPVTKKQIDKRRNFDDGEGETDLGRLAEYFGSARALKDTLYLMILENPTTIVEWGSADQQQVGVALGRAMAHELRHEIVKKPVHATTGLGASSPDVTDDKNYADFSADDRRSIVAALRDLEASQKGAQVIPTFPKSVRTNQDSFPF